MAGRPSKYTPSVAKRICKWVEAGVSVEAAAEAEGVSRATVYNWRDRGLAGEEPYAGFVARLAKAKGLIEARVTAHITRKVKDDWRAGAWYLERRMAQRFGDQGSLDRKLQAEYVRMLDAAKRTMDADGYKAFVAALAADTRED